jgi:antitoxin component of MazEF toxin-antitoxin module
MVKYLSKHGNSLALVIDRPILDILKIKPDSPLEVSTDGQRITIAVAPKADAPWQMGKTEAKKTRK